MSQPTEREALTSLAPRRRPSRPTALVKSNRPTQPPDVAPPHEPAGPAGAHEPADHPSDHAGDISGEHSGPPAPSTDHAAQPPTQSDAPTITSTPRTLSAPATTAVPHAATAPTSTDPVTTADQGDDIVQTKYSQLQRRTFAIADPQMDRLAQLRAQLMKDPSRQRYHSRDRDRITESTLVRLGIDLVLRHAADLAGHSATEDKLRDALGLPPLQL